MGEARLDLEVNIWQQQLEQIGPTGEPCSTMEIRREMITDDQDLGEHCCHIQAA